MQFIKSKLSSGGSNFPSSSPWGKAEKQPAQPTGLDAEKNDLLDKHITIVEGLIVFSRDFVLSLDGMITNVNKLVEVVRAVEPSWAVDSAHSHYECKAQAWSMAMGIKATAPRVGKELKRYLVDLERIGEAAKAAQALLARKTQAQQDRNHYMLKLSVLQEEGEQHGRSGTGEQAQRVQRNQEKLARAQQHLDDCNEAVELVLERSLHQNTSSIVSALHSIAQIASCGWFVSTGAVVCRSLQSAGQSEAEARQPKQQPPPPPQGPCENAARSGVLVLPPSLAQDHFDPPSAFDPADPLASRDGSLLPEPSRLNPTASSVDETEEATSTFEQLSVRELKELLRASGVSGSGCVEKKGPH
jgi:hypothetical protein